MKFIKLDTKSVVTMQELREAHPSMSMPAMPTDGHVAPLGYAVVHHTPPPSGDVVTEGAPALEDGKWHQTWQVRSFTTDENSERMERAKERCRAMVSQAYHEDLELILREYPPAERLTWDKQESEVRAWLSDNSAETPFIDALAIARGMDREELIGRVLTKADAWISASAEATGRRQAAEDRMKEATTVEEIEAIQF